MVLFPLLDPRCVCFLQETTREGALQKLVSLLESCGKLKEKDDFYKAIIAREKLVSTAIGRGVAIPHAKLSGYESFFIAIGIAQQGLDWEAIDSLPVHIIFMVGGPDNRAAEYLQILARLTEAIKEEGRRKKLLQLHSEEEIIELFRGV